MIFYSNLKIPYRAFVKFVMSVDKVLHERLFPANICFLDYHQIIVFKSKL